MEAYITSFNAKNMVFQLDTSVIDQNEEIFRIFFKWFSNHDVKQILAFKLLFEKPEIFFEVYKKKVRRDTKQFLFEGRLPSYHSHKDCHRLKSRFSNIKLPDEIKNSGEEKIIEFRNFFTENIDSFEKEPEFFLQRVKMRFNLNKIPEAIAYENSGIHSFENIDLNTLDNEIENQILAADRFYNSSEKNKIILDNFGKFAFIGKIRQKPTNNPTSFSEEEIWSVLEQFERVYKQPLIHNLQEYFRVKFNPEMKFQGFLLDQLGFNKCNHCGNLDLLEALRAN